MMSEDGHAGHRPPSAPPWAPMTTPSPRAVTLTVVAYASRYQSVVRVSAEVPTGTLFGQLGGPVGVAQVSSLQLLDGTPIPPESSLEEIGVGDGASVLVLSVYDTPPGDSGTPAPEGWAPSGPPADDPMWGVAASGALADRKAADPTSANATIDSATIDWAPRAEQREPDSSFAPALEPASLLPPWPPEPSGESRPGDLPHIASPFALGPATPPLEEDEVFGFAGPRTGATATRPTYERHHLVAVGAAAAAVAVAMAGGVLIGRVSAPSPSGPTPADFSIATQAATTWLAAGTYRPAMVASGTSPSAGRAGTVTGTVRRVGWAKSGGETDVWYILHRAGKASLGLTVQLHGSRISEAPTVTPLSFGGGQVPPKAPPASSPTSTAPAVVTSWAGKTFGRSGPLITTLGVGLIGHPGVVSVASTGPGAAVYRVSVNLSTTAPGTPARRDAAALARDQAKVDSLQGKVTTAQSRLTAAKATVTNDAAKVAAGATTVTADTNAFKAASAATAAADKALTQAKAAKPPPPAATVQAAQDAATKARQTMATDESQLSAAAAQLKAAQTQQQGDQTTLADIQSETSTGESSLAAAQAARTAAQARIPPALSAVGTFDVWVVGGQVKGWVPAGFGGV